MGFSPFPCSHNPPALSTLPQKPSPAPSDSAHSGFSSCVPAQGWQGLGSFFSLPAGLLSPCCRRNKVTWCSSYVHPRKDHRSLKPKIFSYSVREGYSFHLNRGMKLFLDQSWLFYRKQRSYTLAWGNWLFLGGYLTMTRDNGVIISHTVKRCLAHTQSLNKISLCFGKEI